MANEVEIHITAKDDTGRAFSEVKAKAKRAGADAGDAAAEDFSGSFSGKLSKKSVDAVQKAAQDAEAKGKPEFEKAGQKAADDFSGSFSGTLSKKEVAAAQKAAADVTAKTKATYEKAGEEAGKSTFKGYEKGSKETEKKADDTAKKISGAFSGMVLAGLTVGLPAAAAVGAAGVAASLTIATAAFGALGVMALKNTDAVSNATGALEAKVSADMYRMAAPMQGEVVAGIQDIGKAWDQMTPQLTTAVGAAVPQLRQLEGGVLDLAGNAMPGLVTATVNSGAAVLGLRSLFGQTGAGVSDFFTNVSKESVSSGADLRIFGGTVQNLLGFAGQLVANFSAAGAGPLRSFDTTLGNVEHTILNLTASGSPLIGVLGGIGTTVSGLSAVLQGASAVLGLLPPEVGQFAGSALSATAIVSKFGVDVTQSFRAIGPAVKDAEGFTGKLSAGVTGLVSAAVDPATLAVAALGIGLSILGQQQEQAAKYAQDHKQNVQSLTEAIRQDNGALAQNVMAANVKALTDKNAASNLASFGQNLGTAKSAIEGNTVAYDQLNKTATYHLGVIAQAAGLNDKQTESLQSMAGVSLSTGKNFAEMSDAMAKGTGLGAAALDNMTASQRSQVEAILNGTGAVGEQIVSQKQAQDAYLLSEGALNQLTTAQVQARDATVAHTKATQDAVGGELGYRSSLDSTKTAMDTYTQAVKGHGASSAQAQSALLGLENAFHAQVTAAGQAAAATAVGKTANEQASIAAAAMNAETVKLANSWSGQLPASLAQGIGMMSVSEAKAAGLTVTIDGTGKAVYRLPDGKFIAINSSAQEEAQKVADLQRAIDSIHDRNVRIAVTTFYGTVGQGSSLTGPAIARAKGGLVGYASGGQVLSVPRFDGGGYALDVGPGGMLHGPGSGTSDGIFARVSNGEFVVRASETRKNLPLLNAINSGRTGSIRGGAGGVGAASSGGAPMVVQLQVQTGGSGDFERMFAEMIRKYVKVNGGGNVQSAFGQR